MPQLKEHPNWLRTRGAMGDIGVDREAAVIRGYVLAQEGPFKTEGRGEFDVAGLKKIVTLARKQSAGLKSRLAHPTLSADGIGKFLGRVKDVHLDSVRVKRNGELALLHAVRGDLHLDSTALNAPVGGGKPLGQYVMDLAESDSDALSSSLVLHASEEYRLDPKTKRPLLDKEGKELPPLWVPTELHASDIVDTGDAVDGLLSAHLSIGGLPDELVRRASDLLNRAFLGESRAVLKARLTTWLDSYLAFRFGDDPEEDDVQDDRDESLLTNLNMTRGVAELRATLAERGANA